MRRIEELAHTVDYGFDTLTSESYAKKPSLGKQVCIKVAEFSAYSRDLDSATFEYAGEGDNPMELAELCVTRSKHALARLGRRTTTFAAVGVNKDGFVRARARHYLFHTTQRVGANGEILVSVTWDPSVRIYDKDVRGFLCYLRDLCKARNEMLHAGDPESLLWE